MIRAWWAVLAVALVLLLARCLAVGVDAALWGWITLQGVILASAGLAGRRP